MFCTLNRFWLKVFCMLNISLWLFGFFVLNLFPFLSKANEFLPTFVVNLKLSEKQ